MVHAGCNGVVNGEGPGVPLCDGFIWYVTAWSLDVGSGTELQAADTGMMEMREVAMAKSHRARRVKLGRHTDQDRPRRVAVNAGAQAGVVEFARRGADDGQHAVGHQLETGRRTERTDVTNVAQRLQHRSDSLDGLGLATNH